LDARAVNVINGLIMDAAGKADSGRPGERFNKGCGFTRTIARRLSRSNKPDAA